MSQEPKINYWQPTTSLPVLKRRAKLLADVRSFFAARDVMEVETGLLANAGVTDVYIQPILANVEQQGTTKSFYLQTSPEYAMKRLLAFGSGPIYQICKAFRNEEQGRNHHPEFTMLEWYRPGFSHHDLMEEMSKLLQSVADCQTAKKISYQAVFEEFLGFNPHQADLSSLQGLLKTHGIDVQTSTILTVNDCLDLLFTQYIEPQLTGPAPWMIYDYPQSMAALAKIRQAPTPVAERFEVYFKGLELANGYHELTDSQEQRQRFERDLAQRKQLGLSACAIDQALLGALEHGLPACAGVALGIDRLLMAMLDAPHIEAVIPFTL